MRDDRANSVKVSIQGNVVEVTEMVDANRVCHAIKVDKGHWVDPETGEIHEYDSAGAVSRLDNRQELLRTFATIRALVNANCKDPSRIRWVTLTYAENMTDTDRLYSDFKSFWMRFKRRWGKCDYITVVEPQRRGAWHVHLIAIWAGRAPFVPNDELRECWGHGFVMVKAVDDVDNLGAYLSAYLADVEVPTGGVEKVQGDGTTKRFAKGARLSLYPAGMNIYRTSRGIRRPEVFWVDTREDWHRYEMLLGDRSPVYEREIVFRDDEGRERRIWKSQYNLLRN